MTTDSPDEKCKRLCSDFGVATEIKRLQPAHAKTRKLHVIDNLRKYNLHGFA